MLLFIEVTLDILIHLTYLQPICIYFLNRNRQTYHTYLHSSDGLNIFTGKVQKDKQTNKQKTSHYIFFLAFIILLYIT